MPENQLTKCLKFRRKLARLTQAQVAEGIQRSRAAYEKWEIGRSLPSIEDIQEIAKFYNITIDQLLNGDGGDLSTNKLADQSDAGVPEIEEMAINDEFKLVLYRQKVAELQLEIVHLKNKIYLCQKVNDSLKSKLHY